MALSNLDRMHDEGMNGKHRIEVIELMKSPSITQHVAKRGRVIIGGGCADDSRR
jgi:hypothetical protein